MYVYIYIYTHLYMYTCTYVHTCKCHAKLLANLSKRSTLKSLGILIYTIYVYTHICIYKYIAIYLSIYLSILIRTTRLLSTILFRC